MSVQVVKIMGMKTYPIELRQKIVDAVDQQLGTYQEIAEMFGITERYIYKLLQQRRATGSLAPLPRAGGATAKLSEAQLLTLAEVVAQHPDATLAELGRQLQREIHKEVSVTTLWRGLERIEITQKKDPARRGSRPAGAGGFSAAATTPGCAAPDLY